MATFFIYSYKTPQYFHAATSALAQVVLIQGQ